MIRGFLRKTGRIFIMLLIVIIILAMKSIGIFAASNSYYYLQPTLNPSSGWIIFSGVEKYTGRNNPESRKYDLQVREKLARISSLGVLSDEVKNSTGASGTNTVAQKFMILTFPGSDDEDDYSLGNHRAKAQQVQDYLVTSINKAFAAVYPQSERASWDVNDAKNAYSRLLKAAGSKAVLNGWQFSSIDESDGLNPSFGYSKSDYIKMSDGQDTVFLQYRAAKGYSSEFDASYIYWDAIVYEAVNNYMADEPITIDTGSDNSNIIASLLLNLFDTVISSIETLLRLWALDDLVFNEGARSGISYVHGVFPSGWETYIWTFFGISEVIGFAVLLYLLITSITKRALSTANMMGRRLAWTAVQDYIIAAAFMSVLPLFIQALMILSEGLTSAFAATLSGSIKSLRPEYGSGMIGAVVIRLLYLGIDVYFNYFYALRALAVAVLIAVSPVAIVLYPLGGKMKDAINLWLTALISQIIIQPVHAFMFAFILALPAGTHTLDNLIMCYAVIPFSSMIRKLLMPRADEPADAAAQKARKITLGSVKGAAIGAAGALSAGIASGISEYKNIGSIDKKIHGELEEGQGEGLNMYRSARYEDSYMASSEDYASENLSGSFMAGDPPDIFSQEKSGINPSLNDEFFPEKYVPENPGYPQESFLKKSETGIDMDFSDEKYAAPDFSYGPDSDSESRSFPAAKTLTQKWLKPAAGIAEAAGGVFLGGALGAVNLPVSAAETLSAKGVKDFASGIRSGPDLPDEAGQAYPGAGNGF